MILCYNGLKAKSIFIDIRRVFVVVDVLYCNKKLWKIVKGYNSNENIVVVLRLVFVLLGI